MMDQEELSKKDAAEHQRFNPIGSDGYSVFLPSDVRTNLAAYRGGDLVAGNTIFQNLYNQDQNAALSLVDNNAVNHDGILGAMNQRYGIMDDGMVDTENKAAMNLLLENKKNGQVNEQDINQAQQQQQAMAQNNGNLPGSQTNSSLKILQRR